MDQRIKQLKDRKSQLEHDLGGLIQVKLSKFAEETGLSITHVSVGIINSDRKDGSKEIEFVSVKISVDI